MNWTITDMENIIYTPRSIRNGGNSAMRIVVRNWSYRRR